MSVVGDVFAAVRQVVLLDARIARAQADIDTVKSDVDALKSRVGRLEGLIEMAMYVDRRRLE